MFVPFCFFLRFRLGSNSPKKTVSCTEWCEGPQGPKQHIQRNVKASALLVYLFAAKVMVWVSRSFLTQQMAAFRRSKKPLTSSTPTAQALCRWSWVVGYGLVMLFNPLQICSRQFNVFYCSVEKSDANKCLIGVGVGTCVWFFVGLSLQYVPAVEIY